MEPTIEKLLQNIPFAGMGTTLERNGLIGVIRELIKANKYTVDYILNYCESVGYQRNMAEQVFEELTGLSPKLIINNNEYYNAPIYVPACTIAWGIAKTKPNVAFYVVPGSYGYSVMEKNETEAPVEVIQMATIPEAIDELKKVAKKIQTLDKIITSKLLETEDVATIANDIDQTSKPYAAVDPIFELKKNFKNKVIDANGFEREAKKLVAEEKITVDEAEDLMAWKQDLIDEDESYANEVLQHNEEWKPLDADDIDENAPDYENRVKEATTQLSGMIDELDIFKDYAKRSGNDRLFDAYLQLGREIADEWDIKPESLFGEMILENPELVKRLEDIDKENFNKEVETWKKSQEEFPWKGGNKQFSKKVKSDLTNNDNLIEGNWYRIEDYRFLLKYVGKNAADQLVFQDGQNEFYFLPSDTKVYNKNTKVASKKVIAETYKDKGWTIEKTKDGYVVRNEKGYIMRTPFNTEEEAEKYINEPVKPNYVKTDGYPIFDGRRKASKKVTAENITLEDMEDEDNKTEVEKEVEKIEETPIDELLQDTTPLDYFDEEIKEDKVDTINDVVSKCITEFSDKFKDFDKYDIKILSYKTKILDPYTTSSDEMIPDNEVNADAVLQIILAVNNKADNAEVKKLLAVFSITDGKMHWTGTVRDENDKIVAFTDQGLDSIFNDEEVEDVEEVI